MELRIGGREIKKALLAENAGSEFSYDFPTQVTEQPKLEFPYNLYAYHITLSHTIRFKEGQEEVFLTDPLDRRLIILHNNRPVDVRPAAFQMRLIPETEGREWHGKTVVEGEIPILYRNGDFITFRITGVIPGNIGGLQ